MVFDRLTVLDEPAGRRNGYIVWECICACGVKKAFHANHLLRGRTKSCGCLRREVSKAKATTHGRSKTLAHGRWAAMHERCRAPNSYAFKWYGARGIKVCKRWSGSHGFANFLADMGERPDGYSLDRIDNDGDYEPGNCRWATPTEQVANRRDYVPAHGEAQGAAKLTEAQVLEIRSLCVKGVRQIDIASAYNVSQPVVSSIKLRQSWKHLPATNVH